MIDQPDRQSDQTRVKLFGLFIAIGLVCIVARLWYLQIARGEELREASIMNQRRLIRRVPPRGQIEDREGRVLATNRQQLVIAVVPYEIRKNPDVLKTLAGLLNLPAADLEGIIKPFRYSKSYDAVRVAEDVDLATITRIEERRLDLPGVYVYPEPVRAYPDGPLFGHVLGQMGQIRPDELEKRRAEGYRAGDYCGKLGLEAGYDGVLRGINGGREIEVDARGRMLRDVSNADPIAGSTLRLAIDRDLQQTAYKALAEWGSGRHRGAKRGGNPGAVVALDPRNGGVLALATYPSYDPNDFVQGISQADWNKIQGDPLRPQINRCVGSAYAPGSTFKVVSGSAGLECGDCLPNHYETCVGVISLGKWRKRCHGTHGAVDFLGAVAKSCDVYFYRLGQRLGPEKMAEYSRVFGLGERTGIDLPYVESAGIVPTPEWKRKRGRGAWVGGDTVDYAIGQASLATTPLQMCNVAAAIANGGTLYRPRLVDRIRFTASSGQPEREQAIEPIVLKKLSTSPANLARVQSGMKMVMEPGGTAASCAIPGTTMAGKTGTAQVSVRRGEIVNNAWFIGYAPVEDPRIAVCVFIEHGGHGGDAAAPIARQVIARYLKSQGVIRPAINAVRPDAATTN